MNTKSSNKAELVGINDVLPQALWTKYFLEAQGYGTDNLMYQDNQSTMRLAENGKASSGKRTRHINVRYFFITDRIAKKEVAIQYCPTKQMVVHESFTGGIILRVLGSNPRSGPHGHDQWRPQECVGCQWHF
jgi:hypothetical protein